MTNFDFSYLVCFVFDWSFFFFDYMQRVCKQLWRRAVLGIPIDSTRIRESPYHSIILWLQQPRRSLQNVDLLTVAVFIDKVI